VRAAADVPHTSLWRRGALVKGNAVPSGTAIATFNGAGRYANARDGSSHAAILIEQSDAGLSVIDQWVGHAAQRRVIRPKGGAGTANNDADRYYVIEIA
jgi:hypothetical protein